MKTLKEVHSYFAGIYPLYGNPELDITKEHVEMLISCICGSHYRILANGNTPIVSVPKNVRCKNCGELAKGQTTSGHSAGVFNATVRHI